ncbi:maleylpyruvate isomerase [Actinacidiphila alni]|uniref:Maleylpyruvate isomerase n=1 Tax=Actinacidiphila alni TaxID=380248 RepID=A0A1I2GMT9_9ACTN|nr:maleylpyruvate isomerase family mycothiol-dependent enzyme [Actinacidiphila alni]SFF18147.1 maleylpyruvate isomerase [Actinacidiphila alni]
MTVQRPDPARDAVAVREATEHFLAAATELPADALAGPSLLPGWSRGHLLAHVARNADALVNLLTWARTGVETPMYADAATRDRDIEQGAGRPLDVQLDDLRASAARLEEAAAQVPPAGWAAQVTMRSGKVIAAAEVPWRRLVELRLHLVDLGAGYGTADLPAGFAARELAVLADGLTGHEGVAAVRILDTEAGTDWTIGAAAEPDLTVSGATRPLLAWLSGRAPYDGLTVTPDGPLPVLPPL